jgi:hypothetical protein
MRYSKLFRLFFEGKDKVLFNNCGHNFYFIFSPKFEKKTISLNSSYGMQGLIAEFTARHIVHGKICVCRNL